MKTVYFFGILAIFVVLFVTLSTGNVFACTSYSYQQCVGNNLYWYNSCGDQQNLAQYCPNGCYNNSCSYNNNYNNCTYHAYKLCAGSNIFWYDSCGNQQDLYYNCANGQTCQYGQCIVQIQPKNNYIAYYKTQCYNNSIYWYDSLGVASGLYKNCQDANSCTMDTCSASKCSNIVKCDGSACAIGSADYEDYCQTAQPEDQSYCGNGLCEPNLGEVQTNCPNDCKVNINASALSLSFFAKMDPGSSQWQKTVKVGVNSQAYFMISVVNNSSAQIDNVNVSVNIPSEISSLGNLQINGVAVSGDIVSGINIGSLSQATTKLLTFEGKTQTFSGPATKQATATSNIPGLSAQTEATQSDYLSIEFNLEQAVAGVSSAQSTSDIWTFLKHWYLWILGGLVLVFLFVIVFRRLSSEA